MGPFMKCEPAMTISVAYTAAEPTCIDCGACCNAVRGELWCTWCRSIFTRQADAKAPNGWRVRVWNRRSMDKGTA